MTTPPVPVPGVLAVVVRDGQVLLVRRSKAPDKGRWGFPGGRIEPGELYATAALRELREETGVDADAVRLLDALDIVRRREDGVLEHHFVLLAVLCRWRKGEPVAADDALEAAWMPVEALPDADGDPAFSDGIRALIRHATP